MVDYYETLNILNNYSMLNKIAPCIPYAILVIGPGAIFFTVWYSLRKSNKLIDDMRKEFEPEWEESNKIAENITKEVGGLHEASQGLSQVTTSVRDSVKELTDLLHK